MHLIDKAIARHQRTTTSVSTGNIQIKYYTGPSLWDRKQSYSSTTLSEYDDVVCISVTSSGSQLNRNPCQATLPTSTFLTRRDGSIVSDRVSLHAFTQHSFEELQGPLPLLAFPTSTDCKFVRDCVSLRTFSQYSSEELQGLSPLPAFFTRPDDSIVSEHV